MKRTLSLSRRFGWLGANETRVHAALLAAHGAARPEIGFRPADVRFFFLLFTNWMEADVLHPGQDVDLTQVRRMIARLTQAHLAAPVARRVSRRPRHRLTDAGMLAIAEALAEPKEHRSFDETLFVVCFAAAYGELLAVRASGATRRHLQALLDPERALLVGRRALAALLADLDERVRSSLAIEAQARALGARADRDAALLLEKLGGYQLQRVKPLGELLLALPDDLRAFEMSRGMRLRAELLFTPLAEAARAQQGILVALGTRIRG